MLLLKPRLIQGANFVIRLALDSPASGRHNITIDNNLSNGRLHLLAPWCSQSLSLTFNPLSSRLLSSAARHYSSSGGHAPHRSHKDLYSILGVSPKATQQEIKDQFYQLSMLYHPDRNRGSRGAHQRFSEITEAYSILGQHTLRRKYDKGLLQEYPRKPHPDTHHHHHDHHTTGGGGGESDRAMSGTGSSTKKIYDFDEFYRAHYGEALRWQRERTANRKVADAERERLAALSEPMHKALTISAVLLVFLVGWVGAKYKKHLEMVGKWA